MKIINASSIAGAKEQMQRKGTKAPMELKEIKRRETTLKMLTSSTTTKSLNSSKWHFNRIFAMDT